jgi:Domain of unknown function (DUF4160)
MPQISSFYGIVIMMFFTDHQPPHFHAKYAEYMAQIKISDFSIIEGKMPKTALKLIKQWGVEHKTELEKNWNLCREKITPIKIDPLL